MRFEERAVCPALRPLVSKLWSFEGDFAFGLERVLPSGYADLLINLDEDETRTYADPSAPAERHAGSVLGGPRSRPLIIDTHEQRRVLGVVFQPGGARAFFDTPLCAVLDAYVDLDTLWGRSGLRDRLLGCDATEQLALVESALLENLREDRAPEVGVVAAARALDAGARVSDVLERVGMGRKRFGRCFKEAVGMTPKQFAGIRRFRRVIGRANAEGLEAVDWADVAAHCGYFDQPHLIADFRRYAGLTPSRYVPRSGDAQAHVRL